MEAEIDFEIVCHLGFVKNLDIASCGYYFVDVSLSHGDERNPVTPLRCFSAPSNLASVVESTPIELDSCPLLEMCDLNDVTKRFNSRSFYIRYRGQEYELNEGCYWRLTLSEVDLKRFGKSTPHCPGNLYLNFRLLFSDGPDNEAPEQGHNWEVVAEQTLCLQKLASGLQEYYPIRFKRGYLLNMDCLIYCAVSGVRPTKIEPPMSIAGVVAKTKATSPDITALGTIAALTKSLDADAVLEQTIAAVGSAFTGTLNDMSTASDRLFGSYTATGSAKQSNTDDETDMAESSCKRGSQFSSDDEDETDAGGEVNGVSDDVDTARTTIRGLRQGSANDATTPTREGHYEDMTANETSQSLVASVGSRTVSTGASSLGSFRHAIISPDADIHADDVPQRLHCEEGRVATRPVTSTEDDRDAEAVGAQHREQDVSLSPRTVRWRLRDVMVEMLSRRKQRSLDSCESAGAMRLPRRLRVGSALNYGSVGNSKDLSPKGSRPHREQNAVADRTQKASTSPKFHAFQSVVSSGIGDKVSKSQAMVSSGAVDSKSASTMLRQWMAPYAAVLCANHRLLCLGVRSLTGGKEESSELAGVKGTSRLSTTSLSDSFAFDDLQGLCERWASLDTMSAIREAISGTIDASNEHYANLWNALYAQVPRCLHSLRDKLKGRYRTKMQRFWRRQTIVHSCGLQHSMIRWEHEDELVGILQQMIRAEVADASTNAAATMINTTGVHNDGIIAGPFFPRGLRVFDDDVHAQLERLPVLSLQQYSYTYAGSDVVIRGGAYIDAEPAREPHKMMESPGDVVKLTDNGSFTTAVFTGNPSSTRTSPLRSYPRKFAQPQSQPQAQSTRIRDEGESGVGAGSLDNTSDAEKSETSDVTWKSIESKTVGSTTSTPLGSPSKDVNVHAGASAVVQQKGGVFLDQFYIDFGMSDPDGCDASGASADSETTLGLVANTPTQTDASSPMSPRDRHGSGGRAVAPHANTKANRDARRGDTRRTSAHKQEEAHLFVLHHGFLGNSYDMRLLQNALLAELPPETTRVLSVRANEDENEASVAVMGERMANAVADFVVKHLSYFYQDRKPGRISFIGHSMGGVVIRKAVEHPRLEALRRRFHVYISLASPHLGAVFGESGLVSTGMWAMLQWKKSQALRDLGLQDGFLGDPFKSTLYSLSHNGALGHFRKGT
jgi:pimeloyl-ACP methyl ester carboxylesterase